jgi:hypothetical protein
MAFAVKQDEALDPPRTRLLGVDAVVLEAQPVAGLVGLTLRWSCYRVLHLSLWGW